MARNQEDKDMNRDPISGTPGSHPVGVGVGGAAGAAGVGALAGAAFGPVGMLVGGAAGALAGAAAGKGIAERLDPTAESEYWRQEYTRRPYYDRNRDFDRDYVSVYAAGREARESDPALGWDEVEPRLHRDWGTLRGASTLEWEEARPALRDAWERADRTYRAYDWSDDYYGKRFDSADYRRDDETFDDYRPAYRYGTHARLQYPDRDWDDRLEAELESGWERVKGASRLAWERARNAVRDAFDPERPHRH